MEDNLNIIQSLNCRRFNLLKITEVIDTKILGLVSCNVFSIHVSNVIAYFVQRYPLQISAPYWTYGDRGSTVVKVLCYKSVGRWFDPSWCHWNSSLI